MFLTIAVYYNSSYLLVKLCSDSVSFILFFSLLVLSHLFHLGQLLIQSVEITQAGQVTRSGFIQHWGEEKVEFIVYLLLCLLLHLFHCKMSLDRAVMKLWNKIDKKVKHNNWNQIHSHDKTSLIGHTLFCKKYFI